LAVDTSSQEYSKLHVDEKTFIVVGVVVSVSCTLDGGDCCRKRVNNR
jgi:hypothetical protein